MDWHLRFVERDAGYVTPCLEWTGWTNGRYGMVQVNGKRWLVHRLVWAEKHGDPGSLDVLHRCDNPPCGRLDHLFVGTATINLRDASAKGRVKRGEHHPDAKLTEVDVLEMRSLSLPGVELARRFGVSEATVSEVRRRRTWRHV